MEVQFFFSVRITCNDFTNTNVLVLGLLSTTETVYYGKPAVGIPVFYDQYLNMKIAESKGFAVTVSYEDLSEAKLKSAISNILTDPRSFDNTFTQLYLFYTK